MSDLEKNLETLVGLEKEIKEAEAKKSRLENDLESLKKECSVLLSNTDKEIALKKQTCETEYQEKKIQIDNFLKEAKTKIDTASKREEDSSVIEKQIKELNAKFKALKEQEKGLEDSKVSCLEKEKRAELLIEQYNKKLEELNKK